MPSNSRIPLSKLLLLVSTCTFPKRVRAFVLPIVMADSPAAVVEAAGVLDIAKCYFFPGPEASARVALFLFVISDCCLIALAFG